MNLASKKVDVLEQFSNCFLLYAKTLVLCDDISSRWSFCSDSSFSGNDLLAPEMLNIHASNYSLLMPLIPKKYTPLVMWGVLRDGCSMGKMMCILCDKCVIMWKRFYASFPLSKAFLTNNYDWCFCNQIEMESIGLTLWRTKCFEETLDISIFICDYKKWRKL